MMQPSFSLRSTKSVFGLSQHFLQKLGNGFVLAWLLVRASWYVLLQYSSRKRMLTAKMKVFLAESKDGMDGFNSKRFGLYIGAIALIEHLFSIVQDRKLSAQQQHTAFLLSVLTPLFDDLIDDYHYSPQEIEGLCKLLPQRDIWEERACRAIFEEGGFEWNVFWAKVAMYQIKSRDQAFFSPQSIDLKDLTFGKGGHSVLLGWHLIGEERGGEPLRKAAFELGAVAQLLNDVFDIWKDREAGVHTLATDVATFGDLSALYQERLQVFISLVQEMDLPSRQKKHLLLLCMPLFALGFVALWQLTETEQKKGGQVQFQDWSRAELVCDMALWRNRFRWVWVVWRMA